MTSEHPSKAVMKDREDMSLSKGHELELIDRAKQGEQYASRELVDAHKQRLFAFIWRMVRDTDMAEDICQDTFLRAFGALKTFKRKYRFSTWLFTIGYRLALNQIRLRNNKVGISYDFSNTPGRTEKSPVEEVLQSEYAGRLRKIIWDEVDHLAPVQRAAVLMFYREGFSCRQIADTMDMPVATVKSHMYRARQRLRARLEHQGIDDQDLAYLGA